MRITRIFRFFFTCLMFFGTAQAHAGLWGHFRNAGQSLASILQLQPDDERMQVQAVYAIDNRLLQSAKDIDGQHVMISARDKKTGKILWYLSPKGTDELFEIRNVKNFIGDDIKSLNPDQDFFGDIYLEKDGVVKKLNISWTAYENKIDLRIFGNTIRIDRAFPDPEKEIIQGLRGKLKLDKLYDTKISDGYEIEGKFYFEINDYKTHYEGDYDLFSIDESSGDLVNSDLKVRINTKAERSFYRGQQLIAQEAFAMHTNAKAFGSVRVLDTTEIVTRMKFKTIPLKSLSLISSKLHSFPVQYYLQFRDHTEFISNIEVDGPNKGRRTTLGEVSGELKVTLNQIENGRVTQRIVAAYQDSVENNYSGDNIFFTLHYSENEIIKFRTDVANLAVSQAPKNLLRVGRPFDAAFPKVSKELHEIMTQLESPVPSCSEIL